MQMNKKKSILLLLLFLTISISYCQTMMNKDYELFLLKIDESQLNFEKGMRITNKIQTYFNGRIEVTSIDTGNIEEYHYYFSIWDDSYKEFIIKDKNKGELLPKLFFKDKKTALLVAGSDIVKTDLKNNTSIEKSILSSMLIWLENKK